MYQALADAVLVLHLAVVVFVVGGLLAIVAGSLAAWQWVDRLWFRAAHLGAIAVVVVQGRHRRLQHRLHRTLGSIDPVLRSADLGLRAGVLGVRPARAGQLVVLSAAQNPAQTQR
jgi:hypothetical protein